MPGARWGGLSSARRCRSPGSLGKKQGRETGCQPVGSEQRAGCPSHAQKLRAYNVSIFFPVFVRQGTRRCSSQMGIHSLMRSFRASPRSLKVALAQRPSRS